MDNASLYHEAKGMQLKDAEENITANINQMRWDRGGNILDIGCGDGDITVNLLMNKIPNTDFKLVGSDVSAKMIEYANSKFSNNDKVSFEIMDIGAKSVDSSELNKFDHIFSFNCLHWVQDQKQAFRNIYSMMRDKADLLVFFGAKNDMYTVFEALAQYPKWKEYKTDVNKFISPYHNMSDPESTLKGILETIGFKNIRIQYKLKTYYFYDLSTLRRAMEAVNPFLSRIPPKLHDDYFDDYMKEVRKLDLIEDSNNNEGEKTKIRSPYYSMVVYATKDPASR